eukprot:TRINITY_DN17753_c0_g3_i1.p1 TRINITY_DN17753_c0_g3~~TRINITY_DN17753_c0_g3_i1.p1  ORF type:complete len:191 (-),score=21.61 TRINITY_DN17753_c0_g3_i1:512-1024(-)
MALSGKPRRSSGRTGMAGMALAALAVRNAQLPSCQCGSRRAGRLSSSATRSMWSSGSAWVPSPWVRNVAPGFDEPLQDCLHAEREAAVRAARIVDPVVAASLADSTDYGGLVVQHGAVGPQLLGQMRAEAEACLENGWLRANGQEAYGRTDKVCFIDKDETASLGLAGLS